jgi:hypothetical protein
MTARGGVRRRSTMFSPTPFSPRPLIYPPSLRMYADRRRQGEDAALLHLGDAHRPAARRAETGRHLRDHAGEEKGRRSRGGFSLLSLDAVALASSRLVCPRCVREMMPQSPEGTMFPLHRHGRDQPGLLPEIFSRGGPPLQAPSVSQPDSRGPRGFGLANVFPFSVSGIFVPSKASGSRGSLVFPVDSPRPVDHASNAAERRGERLA